MILLISEVSYLSREGRTVLMGVGAATLSDGAEALPRLAKEHQSSGYSAYTQVGGKEKTPRPRTTQVSGRGTGAVPATVSPLEKFRTSGNRC